MYRSFSRAALGAAVPHRKNTAAMQTVRMPLPSHIVLPVSQHVGAPAVVRVHKGEHVDVGTVVAQAAPGISAHIHSGVSGTVEDIGTLRMPDGAEVAAVTVVPDGAQTPDKELSPPQVHDTAAFLAAVQASGLVGLGGAGFPTHCKLAARPGAVLRRLLINAAECEPYLTSDCRTLLEEGPDLLEGIRLVQHFLGIHRAQICIERNKPEAIDAMFRLTAHQPDIEVYPLLERYPQGAEKVLVRTVMGREVPAGGLPADVGALVLNAATVAFIARYLRTGMPLTTRRLTVDGDAVARRQNVEVIVGTPVQEVLDFCGGASAPCQVLMGGPMMGIALPDTAYPVLKHNNGLLTLREEGRRRPQPTACIRCGRCVRSCPMGLAPAAIAAAQERGDKPEMRRLHAELCLGCGCCSYVCPAARPVTQRTRLARTQLQEKGETP